MQIWAGLGNPGASYSLHRHNVGFMAADVIAAAHGFSTPKTAFRSELREGRVGKHRILLLKPQVFMNRSGEAVAEALRFYKLDLDALTVFHDELDLAPMKVKVKVGGGTAGHNGLRSIAAHLGLVVIAENVWRDLFLLPGAWVADADAHAAEVGS